MPETFPPDVQVFVDQQLASGAYRSLDELVSDSLRAFCALKQRQTDLRQEVQAGLDSLDRGEGIELDESELRAFFDDLQARGSRRYADAQARHGAT